MKSFDQFNGNLLKTYNNCQSFLFFRSIINASSASITTPVIVSPLSFAYFSARSARRHGILMMNCFVSFEHWLATAFSVIRKSFQCVECNFLYDIWKPILFQWKTLFLKKLITFGKNTIFCVSFPVF